jgi:uncharacterized membrane protein YkgB
MEQPSLDAGRVDQGLQSLTVRSQDARPIVMRWAVATVALTDIIRAERDIAITWPEIGAVVARWLEDFGRSTGQWKTHTEAALRMSNMGSVAPPSFDSRPPIGWFDKTDRWISMQMQRYGFFLLRVSLGAVFVWFGALKPFGLSPADDLVTKTLPWIPPWFLIPFLGLWEVAIGVGLLYRPLLRVSLLLLFLHLPGTALPLLLLRDVCFTHFPYALTLEGQYIIKNLTLVSAAIVVGGTVRHGRARAQQERVTWWL